MYVLWDSGSDFYVFLFKQTTAYEMRISDWSSDVCSSDLRHVDVDLDESNAGIGVQLAHDVTVGAVRRDKARQHDHTGVDKQLRNFTDTTNVLGAIFSREPEILVDAEANVVAVEAIRETTLGMQHLFRRNCHPSIYRKSPPLNSSH